MLRVISASICPKASTSSNSPCKTMPDTLPHCCELRPWQDRPDLWPCNPDGWHCIILVSRQQVRLRDLSFTISADRVNNDFKEFSSTGGLLVNPLCGEPVLAAVGDSLKVTMATLIWWDSLGIIGVISDTNLIMKVGAVLLSTRRRLPVQVDWSPSSVLRIIIWWQPVLHIMHRWWVSLSARSSQFAQFSTSSRLSTTPRKSWLASNTPTMSYPAMF